MNKTTIRFGLAVILVAFAGMAFAGRMEPPAGMELKDLTDNASGTVGCATDNVPYNLPNAFDIVGDVPSEVARRGKLAETQRVMFKPLPMYISYTFLTPQIVNAYRIYNQLQVKGVDFQRQAPKSFSFEGRNEGSEWIVLDEVSDESDWNALEGRYFECDNTTAYKKYRIRFKSTNGDTFLIIQQIEFFSVPKTRLLVMGTDFNYGKPSPAYGTHLVEKDKTAKLTAPTNVELSSGLRAECVGWTLYKQEFKQGVPDEILEEGVGTAGTFTGRDFPCKWEWKFRIAGEQEGKVVFVSPDGSDENSGATYDKPKRDILNILKSLNRQPAVPGRTVCLLPGIHEIKKELQVTNAISVVGLTGNPLDITVRNVVDATATISKRVFVLNSPQATVSGLTMENGQSYGNGGNAAILSGGGTISNCILKSGMVRKSDGRGAGIYLDSDAALVTHCKFEGGSLGSGSTGTTDGTGAYVVRGRISNCLFVHNATEGVYQGVNVSECSVIRLCGGQLDNCTIVDNFHTGLVAAVRADAPAKAVNCVMARTRSTDESFAKSWAGDAASFVNCATDDAEPINANCLTGSVYQMFADYERGNYCPKAGGILQDNGTTGGLEIPSSGLAGERRIRGKAIDLGCYESAPRDFLIRLR